jgi:prepilin signal peptidase PulO-like enzyme (type II secretory pathway)
MLDQTLTLLYYALSMLAAFFFGLILAKLAVRLITRMGEYIFLWSHKKFMLVLREPRFCLHCKKSIEGKEALPIFGYLLYKGKCSKCKEKRSFGLLLCQPLSPKGESLISGLKPFND